MLEQMFSARHPMAPKKRLLRNEVFLYETVKTFTMLNEQHLHPRATVYSTVTKKTCSVIDNGYALIV